MKLENVPAHGHCEICQHPVTAGARFCGSPECEAQHQQNVKDRKKEVYKFIGLLAAVMVIVVMMRQF